MKEERITMKPKLDRCVKCGSINIKTLEKDFSFDKSNPGAIIKKYKQRKKKGHDSRCAAQGA